MPPPRARRSCRDALRSTQIVGSLQAYSVNRLFAFHDYCQSVSRIRVILIVLFFCAPSIIVLTVLDSIPLQDPMEGWKANTTFWGRTRVNSLVVCSTILVQARTVVPEVQFTTKTIVGIAVSASAGYTAALMLIAKSWVFPVPFASTIGGLPFIITMNILVVVALGTSGREQLKAYFRYSSNLGIQTTMVVVYPAYVAIFLSLHGYPQLAFVLVLPIIKISFKYIIAKMYQDDEDFVPSMVSSVDIFDALYMTKCMQSGGTLVVGFGIIAVDLVQSYVAIASLGRQTKKVREILAISRSGGEAFKVDEYEKRHPNPEVSNLRGIKESARMLHESESVVVVEYIETMAPLTYAIYLTILFHMPNAKYYQDMHGLTEEKLHSVVTNILVYASLEFLSLLHIRQPLKRHFGISVFYQLAFAWEAQWRILLSEFTAWIVVILQFLLAHSGT